MAKVNDNAVASHTNSAGSANPSPKVSKPNSKQQDAPKKKAEKNDQADCHEEDEGSISRLAKNSWDRFESSFVGNSVVFKK
jgi:hypothetical protein